MGTRIFFLFHEDEVYGEDEANECREMIPVKRFPVEKHYGKQREYDKRDRFLYHFQLHQRESPAVAYESHTVGGHLAGVFGKRDNPRDEYHHIERRIGGDYFHLLELEMSVPGESHENIGYYE